LAIARLIFTDVQTLSTDNIDDNLVNFLEKWFPKETKEKQLYNEIERGKELFGEGYVHQPCIIM
jgi:E3 ubiquitin-protein ligase BAH